MGAPSAQLPKAVAPADTTKAQIAALNWVAMQQRIRASQGRRGTFLTTGSGTQASTVPGTRSTRNTLLGQ